ncbi:MAG: hybrid sensor histidine kinase/response regulator [Spirochaetia bacterium]|nr:hybrid sensor histidine kinase/response regulator [Spirochaetia bacterium]
MLKKEKKRKKNSIISSKQKADFKYDIEKSYERSFRHMLLFSLLPLFGFIPIDVFYLKVPFWLSFGLRGLFCSSLILLAYFGFWRRYFNLSIADQYLTLLIFLFLILVVIIGFSQEQIRYSYLASLLLVLTMTRAIPVADERTHLKINIIMLVLYGTLNLFPYPLDLPSYIIIYIQLIVLAIANQISYSQQRKNIELEWQARKKLLEINTELDKARISAHEANKLKDKFFALISHDMRSPMGGIIGFLDYLKENPNLSKASRNTIINDLRDASGAIFKLIETLVKISQIKSGSIHPKKLFINARELANEVFKRLKPQAEAKKISLKNNLPSNLSIFVDESLFCELLSNLISNAIKFSFRKGVVSVFSSKKNCISVKDNGIGVLPEFLPNLFNHEIKTTSLGSAGEKGTGLGLPYCRDIIYAHGGEISVNSIVNKETIFQITLPEFDKIILLIDDQEAHRNIMKEAINSTGIKVEFVEAENGLEALQLIKKIVPNLIITDIEMPKINGYEFISKVRKRKRLMKIPILASSSYHSSKGESETVRDKSLKCGASAFIEKPVEYKKFVSIVKKLMSEKQSM